MGKEILSCEDGSLSWSYEGSDGAQQHHCRSYGVVALSPVSDRSGLHVTCAWTLVWIVWIYITIDALRGEPPK